MGRYRPSLAAAEGRGHFARCVHPSCILRGPPTPGFWKHPLFSWVSAHTQFWCAQGQWWAGLENLTGTSCILSIRNKWSRAQHNAKVSKLQAVQPLVWTLCQETAYNSFILVELPVSKEVTCAAIITMDLVHSLILGQLTPPSPIPWPPPTQTQTQINEQQRLDWGETPWWRYWVLECDSKSEFHNSIVLKS